MRGSVMQGTGKKDVAPVRRWHLCCDQKKPTAYHFGAKCSWLREVEMQRPRVSNEPVYLRGRKKAMVPGLRWEEETGIRIKLELWAEARWERQKALRWQVLSWKWLSLIYIFKKLLCKSFHLSEPLLHPLWDAANVLGLFRKFNLTLGRSIWHTVSTLWKGAEPEQVGEQDCKNSTRGGRGCR